MLRLGLKKTQRIIIDMLGLGLKTHKGSCLAHKGKD